MLDLLLQERKLVFCLLNSGDEWDKDVLADHLRVQIEVLVFFIFLGLIEYSR